jgi:hypothetical protein
MHDAALQEDAVFIVCLEFVSNRLLDIFCECTFSLEHNSRFARPNVETINFNVYFQI